METILLGIFITGYLLITLEHSLKIDKLDKQMNSLKNKLNNKAYLKNAPKDIVQNDKKLLKELTVEDNKLRSIVSSIN